MRRICAAEAWPQLTRNFLANNRASLYSGSIRFFIETALQAGRELGNANQHSTPEELLEATPAMESCPWASTVHWGAMSADSFKGADGASPRQSQPHPIENGPQGRFANPQRIPNSGNGIYRLGGAGVPPGAPGRLGPWGPGFPIPPGTFLILPHCPLQRWAHPPHVSQFPFVRVRT